MINFYVHFVKPLISGQMLQVYVVFSSITLLTVWGLMLFVYQRKKYSGHMGRISIFAQLFLVFLLIVSFFGLTIPAPKLIKPTLPLFDAIEITDKSPFVIAFDKPLGKHVKATLIPEVLGVWKLSTSQFSLPFNQLVFMPSEPLARGTEYLVEVSNIAPFTGLNFFQDNRLLFIFKTPNTTEVQKPITDSRLLKIENQNNEPTPTPTIQPTPTPAQTSFILNVPQYKQHYTFTCFSVAAKMALGYRGVTVDEIGFLHEIGFDTAPRNFATNTWGDPNKAVVGTYDGSGDGGYGVHWDPVANTMKKYRNVEVKHDWNIPEMLKKVEEGNPVMVWWVNGVWPAKDVSWNLSTGGKVYAVNGMHVEVVVGWTGERDSPTYILTDDPWRGRRSYTPEQFSSLWKWFGNTGIIVY